MVNVIYSNSLFIKYLVLALLRNWRWRLHNGSKKLWRNSWEPLFFWLLNKFIFSFVCLFCLFVLPFLLPFLRSPFICLSGFYVRTYLSMRFPVHPCAPPSIRACPYIRLSMCQSIRLPMYQSVRQSTILSDEGPMLERPTILSVLAVHRPFYISICISTLPTQHMHVSVRPSFSTSVSQPVCLCVSLSVRHLVHPSVRPRPSTGQSVYVSVSASVRVSVSPSIHASRSFRSSSLFTA